MLPRLLVAAAVAALLIPATARASSLFGSWNDLRELAGVDRAAALTAGPDGRIWYSGPGSGSVGAIDADGRATPYALPEGAASAAGYGLSGAVFPNQDGTAWVLDGRARLGLWRVGESRLLRQTALLPSPDDDAFPAWRTPDGSIWTYEDELLAQHRPDGRVARRRPFGRDGDIDTAAVGPDGRLWLYGSRAPLERRLAKVDGQGRAEIHATGEDAYEGATLSWGANGVVAGDTLWYPAARTVRGRDVAVLLGAAPGRPLQQIELGVGVDDDGWDGGVSVGAGPGGSIAFAERPGGTIGLVQGTTVRRLAALPRGDRPQEPVLDAAGRIWVSLSNGRLAAVDPSGAVRTYEDAIPRDHAGPRLSLEVPSRSLARLRAGKLGVRIGCERACGAEIHLAVPRSVARRLGVRDRDSVQVAPLPRGWVPIATAAPTRPVSGTRVAGLKVLRGARRALAGRGALRVRLIANAFDHALDLTRESRRLTLR